MHFAKFLASIYTVNLPCITVYILKNGIYFQNPLKVLIFKGLNGGSGWTRTTDLTLISRSFISLKPIELGFLGLSVQSTVQNII